MLKTIAFDTLAVGKLPEKKLLKRAQKQYKDIRGIHYYLLE